MEVCPLSVSPQAVTSLRLPVPKAKLDPHLVGGVVRSRSPVSNCDPTSYNLPGFSVQEISQARIL